ncbi:class I SAM-dependent methyltransferase [Bosea vestrisii]|uniref:class I SAM-dependent methyltransferase n=1 Tax=Bosea vestrisii TaxID=151416 RepID=UPI0024DF5C08|nr:class I SAM-dependent methyltransferase [Bosea vestrisii]WID98759.1 class I SAM-dependent methyltransferase [Bosea vestrisii]
MMKKLPGCVSAGLAPIAGLAKLRRSELRQARLSEPSAPASGPAVENPLMEEDAYIGKWVRPNSDAPLEMVGRKGSHDLDWIAGYIIQLLDIRPDDTVLDVCCGNGLITARIAPKAKAVTGLDYSQVLLKQAREISAAPNLVYAQADATKISEALGGQKFNKILLCSAFQYFDDAAGRKVLSGLREALLPGGTVAICDIPDKSRRLGHRVRAAARLLLPSKAEGGASSNERFPSIRARLSYLARNVAAVLKRKKTDDLGWWWARRDFAAAAGSVGFECQLLDQPKNHPLHSYRFDALLT